MANGIVAEASGSSASDGGSHPKRSTMGVGPDGGGFEACGEG